MPEPGLYPQGTPRPTTSRAEQALHRALGEKLPKGWFAWHSLRVRAGARREGEGDFVLAIPKRGILVIEVKGGAIEVSGGHWLQNGRPMKEAPRDQASRYRKKLKSHVEKIHGDCPWIAVATAFPETPFSQGPSEGAIAGAVIGQQDLPYLDQALEALVAREFETIRPPRDRRWIDALHQLWCETWTPTLTLGDRNKLRAEELVALDADQLQLLDMIEQNERMLVSGGPGTGKTLVARELYRRLEAKGSEPVFLCSTRALAAGMRAWGIERSWTVPEFAAHLLGRAGIAIQGGEPLSQWTSETWAMLSLQAAADALPAAPFETGAVVVDEAQDLTDDDWSLCQVLAEGGVLWAFADAGQSFWRDRLNLDQLLPASLCLTTRYRCPEALARYADRYRAVEEREMVDALVPFDELRVVRAASESAIEAKVAIEIDKAISSGATASDIAVISLAGLTRSSLAVAERIGRHEVVRADHPEAGEHLISDTFLRFKGLERPWVIVSELYLGGHRYDVRMHVALTRATVGCVIVATGEQIDSDERLVRVS